MDRKYNFEIKDSVKFFDDLKDKSFVKISSDDMWSMGYETKPFVEYKQVENFPNCCNYHRHLKLIIDEWFSKFPNCCDDHKLLSEKQWFDKQNFNHVPEKILSQLNYTLNFIDHSIDQNNWYKEITDYIEYTSDSFGEPGIGEDRFYHMLLNWLENTEKYNHLHSKKEMIITFLKSRNISVEKPEADLNRLISTFQKWVKVLPNLPFFSNYKLLLSNKIPLGDLLYAPDYNRFTGTSKFKCKTHNELIELLVRTTKDLLLSINTTELLKGKHISEIEKHKIDIRNEQHNLKQGQLLLDYTESEIKYVKIIKKWLSNEKKYLKDIEQMFLSNNHLKSNDLESVNNLKDTVFLSYSWDNETHKDKVLSFCNFLRQYGFNCEMDRSLSQKETSIDFNKMMYKSI